MANAQLFKSMQQSQPLPAALARNAEGTPAYALTPRHQLAQYAATGCLNATFYASAEAQLATVLELCKAVEPSFIAQTAVYCRERGYMKDMPALLVAVLAGQGAAEFAPAFQRVINNGKMLRNFVQIMRSGAVGRKSLGSRPKKLVQAWLNSASEQALLAAAVGNSPSLADVVKMVHPKPKDAWRAAFFAWLIGREYIAADLPPVLAAFETYKLDPAQTIPDVPFQMLTALPLGAQDWAQIARQGGWQMVRMNLNTFARHGVYAIEGMPELIAARLRDPASIAQARVFPYQLMSAYMAAGENVPTVIRDALEQALETSLLNVPRIAGKVVVCPDVSGSMSSPVSGFRGSATSNVRCIDVAALVAAAMLRKNPDAMVLPFEHSVVTCRLDAHDSVMENAARLAAIGGGGTSCSAPLLRMNSKQELADLVIYVSDNESWIDAKRSGATATLGQWNVFKQRNPQARLVCIDISPHATTQAMEREDILNIGGFSDDVFKIIAAFAAGQLDPEHWVGEIAAIDIAAGC
ncbi:vWA domain-containing protein [Janthinobacterium sp. 1_2014MBL_MicDiv]|uniref:vWA domain-containing protein n=1 Tax=Janthinobacterium sp. 1_2014MBL_MicDiv TaxID=1644131 RepID=UPI0008F4BB5C|nr:TROVE domain-containing protein [Janthinobacterium sp. 1_2014MBL_MicDiv]APA70062.1 RNA-binding protein [Janthinobacterium sp. 1_2014MBL_MicDiv]